MARKSNNPVQDGQTNLEFKEEIIMAKDYKNVIHKDHIYEVANERLEKDVKALCKDGWKIQGGLSFVVEQRPDITFYILGQSMVKE